MSHSDRLAQQEGSHAFIETILHGGGSEISTGAKGRFRTNVGVESITKKSKNMITNNQSI
jgi:hypothetical protein